MTEAVVLGRHDFGEANRWYHLLTPDFGLVVARAQGVRELKSKLNGHLALFGHAQISLVRGREYWRLIGAEEALHEKFSPASLKSQARVAGLLRRLLPEAGADPELFALVQRGFSDLPAGEVALVWNILRLLGYIAVENPSSAVQPSVDCSDTILIEQINRALSHSQL